MARKDAGLYYEGSSPPDVLKGLFTDAYPDGFAQAWFFNRWFAPFRSIPKYDDVGPYGGCRANP
jgi:hypothetical protein